MKLIWLKKIPRADSFNTKHVGVSILNFEMKYTSKAMRVYGNAMRLPRLTAVQTIFNYTNDGVSKVFHVDSAITYEKQHRDDVISI